MTFRTFLATPLRAIGRALPLALVGALALSACVPIPYSSGKKYVPNGTDVTRPAMDQGGCGFGPDFAANGYRDFGDVRVSVAVLNQASKRILISAEHRSRSADPGSVRIDPSRIRLEEGGQGYPVESFTSNGDINDRPGGLKMFLTFPPETLAAESLRLVFAPGAVVIDGVPVEFAPIRFAFRETTSVYLFPCIPS